MKGFPFEDKRRRFCSKTYFNDDVKTTDSKNSQDLSINFETTENIKLKVRS